MPSLVRNQTLRLSDSWKWVHGKHTMTVGGEMRRIQLNSEANPVPRGSFNFTGVMTSQLTATGQPVPATPQTEPYYELADFLLGLPYSTTVQFGPNIYLRSWDFIGYAQDDWRMTKQFTLLYGLRYEAVDAAGGQIRPDRESGPEFHRHGSGRRSRPAAWERSTARTRARWSTAITEIGRRASASPGCRAIKPKTVIRGGYSIFYNVAIYNSLAQKYLVVRAAVRDFGKSDHLRHAGADAARTVSRASARLPIAAASILFTRTATRRSGRWAPKRPSRRTGSWI